MIDIADGRAYVSADNAAANADLAAPGEGHFWAVTQAFVGFSDSSVANKLVQLIQDAGGTPATLWEGYVTGSRDITFSPPLPVAVNKSVRLALAASGTGGTLGKANLLAYKVRQ